MKLLEDRIVKDGKIGEWNVLKVDSFLNHRIGVTFLDKPGMRVESLARVAEMSVENGFCFC